MTQAEFLYLVFCILAGVIGACVGSFLNVLIYRIPAGESLVKGASHCVGCGHKIRWYDNIPIFSYLFLRGRCRDCGQRISPRYLLVELLNTALWLGFALLAPRTGYAYACTGMLFCSAAVCVGFIDLAHGIIPDRFNLFILLVGIAACIFDSYIGWQSRLYGAAFCLAFFGGTYLIARFLLKKEAMGLGDVKFMAVSGLALGLKASAFATLTGCVAGAVVLLCVSAARKDERGTEYPFAPFLAAGCIAAALAGEMLVNLYLALF